MTPRLISVSVFLTCIVTISATDTNTSLQKTIEPQVLNNSQPDLSQLRLIGNYLLIVSGLNPENHSSMLDETNKFIKTFSPGYLNLNETCAVSYLNFKEFDQIVKGIHDFDFKEGFFEMNCISNVTHTKCLYNFAASLVTGVATMLVLFLFACLKCISNNVFKKWCYKRETLIPPQRS